MNKKTIATFAIDENSVEQSDYSWRDMFYKQFKFPLYLFALYLGGLYIANGEVPMFIQLMVIGLIVYSTWPAIGAYWYWRVE